MQFEDQHRDAIAKTISVKDEISVAVFSDKVKPMGTVTVSRGTITVKLDFIPSGSQDCGPFVIDAIGVALDVCWQVRPQAFDPQRLP